MSKTISVPLAIGAAAVTAPVIAAAAGIAAAGMGAAWLAKKAWEKGKAVVASLSPEDRAYLLPFGADEERLKLEAATITYQPFEGIDFGQALPAFGVPSQGSLALPSAKQMSEAASFTSAQEAALKQVEMAAQALGFQTERRALPPESSVLVFDLFQPERTREVVPRQIPRRPL
ncbi:MAG: hypothetical protein JTT11_10895 [Candidatus Brockarchaeota archaeon]|nr:hypothetical protein [Candidatus Brockarchaeota archaeon]